MVLETLHAYDFVDEDVPGEDETSPGEYLMHMWCLDAASAPVVLTLRGFRPECYIEIPMRVSPFEGVAPRPWRRDEMGALASAIEKTYKVSFASWEAVRRRKLYYYQNGDAAFNMLRVSFHTRADMMRVAWSIERAAVAGSGARGRWYGSQFGRMVLRAWEHDVPIARKLVTAANISFAGWFSVDGAERVVDSNYSCREIGVEWAPGVLKAEFSVPPSRPSVLSFDIEAYSDNPLAMPNPDNVDHSAYMVSCVFSERATGVRTRVLIATRAASVGPRTHPAFEKVGAPDRVVVTDDERGLLEELCDLVATLDPDIIIGYNIHGFDYKYLDTRHQLFLPERRGVWDPRLSRVAGDDSVTLKSRSWRSGAFGISETHELAMEGRISIDLMTIVRRDYKLVKYNLDTAARTILGGNSAKLDVTPREMFERYETGLATVGLGDDSPERVAAVAAMTDVAAYAMRDSDLVLDIFERVNLWIGLVELSSVAGVTIRDTFARGQQCRIVSAVYDIASREGTVLDRRKPPRSAFDAPENDDAVVKYTGGYVQAPIPGIHDNVICVDFASLYPSIMCAYNISHDTLTVRTAAVESVFSGAVAAHDAAVNKHLSIADPAKDTDPRYAVPDGTPVNTVQFVEYEGGSQVDEHAVIDAPPVSIKDTDDQYNDAEDAADARRIAASYSFEFVDESVRRGILPRLVERLVTLRRKTRASIKDTDDPVERSVLHNRQLAYKVMANSVYGFVGAQHGGQYSMVECAMSVTARGRELIQRVNRYVEETYDGRIIYGDTDSSFFELPRVVNSAADCDRWGRRLADELSALFPDPLRLEFEKAVRILCLKKKKYAALLIEPNGNFADESMLTRGIVLARRDNCKFLHRIYMCVLDAVLRDMAPPETVFALIMHALADAIENPRVEEFEIVKSYNPPYKSASYQMNVFGKSCALSGHPPSPGDRLGFVILDRNMHDSSHIAFEGVKDTNLGLRMCLTDVYRSEQITTAPEQQHQRPTIDVMYYVQHMFEAPIDQVFSIVYGTRIARAVVDGLTYKPPRGAGAVSCITPVQLLRKFATKSAPDGISALYYAHVARCLASKFEALAAAANLNTS